MKKTVCALFNEISVCLRVRVCVRRGGRERGIDRDEEKGDETRGSENDRLAEIHEDEDEDAGWKEEGEPKKRSNDPHVLHWNLVLLSSLSWVPGATRVLTI